VLDHVVAAACESERRASGAVEGASAITARAHDINGVIRHAFGLHCAGESSPDGAGEFERAFSLGPESHEEGAGLGGAEPAVKEFLESGFGHGLGEVFSVSETIHDISEFNFCVHFVLLPDRVRNGFNLRGWGHDFCGEIRQKAHAVRRQDGLRVELNADPGSVVVLKGHDLTEGGAGGHSEIRIGVVVIGNDDEGMVAADAERIGQLVEESSAVVGDVTCHAVHDDGANLDRGTGEEPEDFMTEAYAENGNGLGKQFEKIQAEAGFFGNAGAGGQDDFVESAAFRKVENLRIVVFENQRVLSEALKVLNEVVGKGIVVID